MKFFLKFQFFFLLSIGIKLSDGAAGACSYCDPKCLEGKVSDTLKIIQRLQNKADLDSYTVTEESTVEFDLDFAIGKAISYRAQVSNLLSAKVEGVKTWLNEDKTEIIVTGTLIIPKLLGKSNGMSSFKTKNSNLMSGLQNIAIPIEIITKGEMEAVFRNTPIDFNMTLQITRKPTGKIALDPKSLNGQMLCTNANDSDFNFKADPSSGDLVARAIQQTYVNMISKTMALRYCEELTKNQSSHFNENFLKDFKKFFTKVVFNDDGAC